MDLLDGFIGVNLTSDDKVSTDYFTQKFWGEKNHGFDVLYHNMKHGQTSVKDLQDFIRESANAEEMYAKHMTKLAKQAANCSHLGTFSPLMEVFKGMTEKLSSCHMDIVLKLQEIIKELSKYLEEQKNKHKQMKDELNSTAEALHNIQSTTAAVSKSKEKYHQLSSEAERLKRSSAVTKDIDKADMKSKKAADEYRSQVDKYSSVREQFEKKMIESTKTFQDIEEHHLWRMKTFLDTYILSFTNANVLVSQVHQEFQRQVDESTIDILIQQFSDQKGTGTERPGPMLFEEWDPTTVLATMENGTNNHTSPPENNQNQSQARNKKETSGLFGLRRRKQKQKNDSSNISVSSKESNKDAESMESPDKEKDFKVDEEGFTIRPEETDRSEKGSFKFSSTDSDSDSDSDDAATKKIQVRIKPKEATDSGGSDLETLNAITKNLTLGSPSPLGGKKPVQTEYKTKPDKSSLSSLSKSERLTNKELLDLFASGNETKTSTEAESGSSISKTSGSGNDLESFDPFSIAVKPTRKSSLGKGPAPLPPTALPHSSSAKSFDDTSSISDTDTSSKPEIDIPPPRPPKPTSVAPPISPDSFSSRPNDLTLNNMNKPTSRGGTPSFSAPLASSESWSSLSSVGTSGGVGTPSHAPAENFTSSFASISRGPSPLAISHTDPIPIAVAFTETVNAYFKGADSSRSLTKTTGELHISFPAGITRAFTSHPNPPILSFRIPSANTNVISNITHDTLLVRDTTDNHTPGYCYSFDMPLLVTKVRKMTEDNPNNSHYNIHIISYQVPSKHDTMPVHVTSSWKCEPDTTEINIHYKYNSSATSAAFKSFTVIVPVDGGVTDASSTPQAIWNGNQNRLYWKLPGILSSAADSGSLQSTLKVGAGPSKPTALAVQFMSEGSTVSGADFELTGMGYRLSLIRKRIITGKYLSES